MMLVVLADRTGGAPPATVPADFHFAGTTPLRSSIFHAGRPVYNATL